MQLPFSIDQFFEVIRTYNESVWPVQFLLVALAVSAFALLFVRRSWTGVAISAILAFLWAWVAIGYHLAFFTAINPLAYAFAALSLIAASVFVWQGIVRRTLTFVPGRNWRTAVGAALVLFALVVYPAWSTLAGHGYPALPTFGLPCPTTIFTIGMLTVAAGVHARRTLAVPIIWSLIGGQAAFLLDVPPDLGLLAAGLIGIAMLLRRGPTTGAVVHA